MAEDQEPIELNINFSEADKAAAQLNNMAAAAGHVEKSSAGARLAMWGAGEQVQNLGEKLGLPVQMSRRLGNTFEDLIHSMGRGAIAFGAIGIVATAAYEVYSKLAESQKKQREEMEKTTQSALDHTRVLYEDKLETFEVQKAKEELARTERDIYLANSKQVIENERKDLEDLEKQRARGMGFWRTWWEQQKAVFAGKNLDNAVVEAQKKYNDELDRTIAKKKAEIGLKQQERNAAGRPLEGDEQDQQVIAYYKYLASGDLQQRALDADAKYLSERLGLYKSNEMTMKEINQAELDSFDAITRAKVNSLKYEDDIKQYYHQRNMERQVLEAQQKKKLADDEQKQLTMAADNYAATFEHMGNAMKMYYDEGHRMGRKAFTQYKLLEESRIIASTASAVMKSLDEGGPFGGWALAAAIIAEGAMQLNKVRGLTPEGGTDLGLGGAMPTYNAEPTTGLPYLNGNQQQKTTNLTVIINGEEKQIGQIADGVVQNLADRDGVSGRWRIDVVSNA